MRKFLFYLMALPSVFLLTACGDDGDDDSTNDGIHPGNSTVTVTLTAVNYTKDGYFDGILYYKITSNSPQEVTVNKAENSAVVVEIPSIVNIDGSNYKCTSISEKAFNNCGNMTMITIPPTIKSIGSQAFSSCYNLAGVNIYDLAAWCNIKFESSICMGRSLFLNGKEAKELNIPKGVTSIGAYAFCGCSSLVSVDIPNSVTSIGFGAFGYCRNLTSIDIPNSVTSIEEYAFDECRNLVSIEIPNSVTSIGAYAFDGCSRLVSVDIPNSVTSIGKDAFFNCNSLTSVHCKATVPPRQRGYAFYYNIYNNATLYVPKGTLEAYKSDDGWKQFKNIVEES